MIICSHINFINYTKIILNILPTKYSLFLDRESIRYFHVSFEKEILVFLTFYALSILFIQMDNFFYKEGIFSFVILI
ncbi:hypothetical protein D7D25_03615 [Proteiniphilum sp. X52]|nr:hypothetical protein D7D25_03615 [Proteiniphilum sp. X52]